MDEEEDSVGAGKDESITGGSCGAAVSFTMV